MTRPGDGPGRAPGPGDPEWKLDVLGDPEAPWSEQPEAYTLARAVEGDEGAQAYLDELMRRQAPPLPLPKDRWREPS